MCPHSYQGKKSSGARWPHRSSVVGSSSATTCIASRRTDLARPYGNSRPPLGQPGNLHNHIEVGCSLPGVDAFQRSHIGVVPAHAHTDVLLGDLVVTGRVVVPPTSGPCLYPGMASSVHRIAHFGVTFGMQVARHIT